LKRKAIWRNYIKFGKEREFNIAKNTAYKNVIFLELKRIFTDYTRKRMTPIITSDNFHFYIRRHIYILIKPILKKPWPEKSMRYYFDYMIQMAEGAGYIKRTMVPGVWEILDRVFLES